MGVKRDTGHSKLLLQPTYLSKVVDLVHREFGHSTLSYLPSAAEDTGSYSWISEAIKYNGGVLVHCFIANLLPAVVYSVIRGYLQFKATRSYQT